mmetsp:Transcript_57555/g.136901  ORF Transcript_57555/g.136901 Transcript_57555/m.136901 type:complete len:166 (-) Transcript_57555:219-716(-)
MSAQYGTGHNADQLIDEQIQEFREVFDLFDEDKDGRLSKKELGTMLTALGQSPSEDDLNKMIRQVIGTNGPQEYDAEEPITFEDFLSLMAQKIKEGDSEDELIEAFKVFDRDNDGYINAEELRFSMVGLGEKLSDQEVDDMIQEADHDGDQAINYDEFVNMMKAK